MKTGRYIAALLVTLVLEVVCCLFFFNKIDNIKQDTVMINECVKSVEENYGDESAYSTSLDYVLISGDGEVLYRTADGLSESINEAVKNGDTILDVDGVGKIIINNTTSAAVESYKRSIIAAIVIMTFIQILIIALYVVNIKRNVTDPFTRMNEFAVRIAGGDLDVPLEVDGKHVFGEFTEAFDLMRTELKNARQAEKKANDDKKELVAKLSHDIKTPVASIKSASEVGYEITKEDKTKEYFNQINVKADQIKVLVDNLFNSSVQDITSIPVEASSYDSSVLEDMVRNADYLRKASSFTIPSCSIHIDKLRMQQTLDNIFVNSYKYADTAIDVEAKEDADHLVLKIADKGPGVKEEEIPLLKEKYKRGTNSSAKDGAGLGLFLADYFMTNMDGQMKISSGDPGFVVELYIRTI